MNRYKDICIESGSPILAALKQMDAAHRKLLFVTKGGQYHNLLSIGDIQRAILKGENLNNPLDGILRPATNVATIHQSRAEVEQYVRDHKTEFMPIIDDDLQLVDVVFLG
jgi:hypothetical protein